jgi:hypothetical protein
MFFFDFFLKKNKNYTVIVQRGKKNFKFFLYPRGDSTQSCATLCSQGGKTGNLNIARGNLQFFFIGVSQNSLTLHGGKNLLTLFLLTNQAYLVMQPTTRVLSFFFF